MSLREPARNASAEEWRRYAARCMRAASHALTWAIERADEPIAKAIDGTYRSVIDWLERQVDSR